MATMAKLHAQRTQPSTQTVTSDDKNGALRKTIRASLENKLDGWKLVGVRIRGVEGKTVEGFLKVDVGKGERLLVDFKAALTPEGGLSSVEVGGKNISLATGPATKRPR